MTRIGAREVARLLGLDEPTDEQAAVIESPLAPAVVIAGAGSGKTETMAARVVWLVANRLVAPEAILGLTFTRKAAAELGRRIRWRLAGWRHVVEHERPEDHAVIAELIAGEPTVPTYSAYAARLVSEHAMRVGAEPNPGCSRRRCAGSSPTRWSAATAGRCRATSAPGIADAVRHGDGRAVRRSPGRPRRGRGVLPRRIDEVCCDMRWRTAAVHGRGQVGRLAGHRLALLPLVRDYAAREAGAAGGRLRRSDVARRAAGADARRRPCRARTL